ncbi:SDR family oxidoreductase [Paenibacillus tarimensis]
MPLPPHRPGNRPEERIAVVTGTSSGFGLLTAVTLSKRGFRVVAAMRDLSRAGDLRSKAGLEGVSERIVYERLDVTDLQAIPRVVAGVLAAYGRIDVLVNNAGFAVGGFVEEVPMDDWRLQMETNFFGLVALTKAVLPAMREQGSGLIVNIGSVSGRIGFPGYAPYAASKFAVAGFSESLRHEMSPYGVRVALIEPGAYRTPIWRKGLEHIRSSAGSPYDEKLQAVLRYSRRAADQAPDPQEVAELVGRIAVSDSGGFRFPVGRGSRLLLWGKALLPWNWLERLIARALSR